eukprot:TRINITY_DN3248_c0_g1_i1.p1 TRINITY_DN3248_c0_g1~~TRINITY_DN3248_c0_g1_i1.p1  ORF type:complete len:410 (-),score=71.80 TRINITY_DN3248_c0_g1_i1:11-1240(-)
MNVNKRILRPKAQQTSITNARRQSGKMPVEPENSLNKKRLSEIQQKKQSISMIDDESTHEHRGTRKTTIAEPKYLLSMLTPKSVKVGVNDKTPLSSKGSQKQADRSTVRLIYRSSSSTSFYSNKNSKPKEGSLQNTALDHSALNVLIDKSKMSGNTELMDVLSAEIEVQSELEEKLRMVQDTLRREMTQFKATVEENQAIEDKIKDLEKRVGYLRRTEVSLERKVNKTNSRVIELLQTRKDRERSPTEEQKSRFIGGRGPLKQLGNRNLDQSRDKYYIAREVRSESQEIRQRRSQMSVDDQRKKRDQHAILLLERVNSRNRRLSGELSRVTKDRNTYIQNLQQEKSKRERLEQKLKTLEDEKSKLLLNVKKNYQAQKSAFTALEKLYTCLLYTSPSPRDRQKSRMPSSA